MNATPSAVESTVERTPFAVWAGLAAIALGWFGMSTLVSTFGPIQHLVRFYDMATVIHDPSWLVHGLGSAHTFGPFAFGSLSALVLVGPLLAHRAQSPQSRLLYLLPLTLMLVCGGILYHETSQPYVTVGSGAGAFGEFAARVANDVIGRGADTIARHISVGLGGYLSLAAALYLACQGLVSSFSRK